MVIESTERVLNMKFYKLVMKFFNSSDIDKYLKSGRIPWSVGYKPYRYNKLKDIPTDQSLLDIFALGKPLPKGFGVGLDERIVEYPWLLSRLADTGSQMLDAGSVLNYPFILDAPQVKDKRLVIQTLAPESTMTKRKHVSYMFGDLRETLFKDDCFDVIVSISTLEHIGMDNAKLYTQDAQDNESQPDDCMRVIEEIRRILKPGGRFMMTVPFGKPQDLGWLNQFDNDRLKKLISTFGSELEATTFYKYGSDGWVVSDEDSCVDCEYFDVHSATTHAPDLAAAARAVACLEFVKHV